MDRFPTVGSTKPAPMLSSQSVTKYGVLVSQDACIARVRISRKIYWGKITWINSWLALISES
jgi:hypothetical protein